MKPPVSKSRTTPIQMNHAFSPLQPPPTPTPFVGGPTVSLNCFIKHSNRSHLLRACSELFDTQSPALPPPFYLPPPLRPPPRRLFSPLFTNKWMRIDKYKFRGGSQTMRYPSPGRNLRHILKIDGCHGRRWRIIAVQNSNLTPTLPPTPLLSPTTIDAAFNKIWYIDVCES